MTRAMAPIVFGECVVRTDPARAHVLLMTPPGSLAERAAIDALAPAFGDCVVQGGRFTATRPILRGLVAISYYRLAHAARVAPGAGR